MKDLFAGKHFRKENYFIDMLTFSCIPVKCTVKAKNRNVIYIHNSAGKHSSFAQCQFEINSEIILHLEMTEHLKQITDVLFKFAGY